MHLSDSPFSSVNLKKDPNRFLTLLGVNPKQFDEIFEKVYNYELINQKQRHILWREERVKRMVDKYSEILREYLCITLLYLRQYNIQTVIATGFGISQVHVSRIIERISKALPEILPVPERAAKSLEKQIKQISPEAKEKYNATLIIDASEQNIQRNQDNFQQKEDYSGKKKFTAKSSKLLKHKAG